MPEKTTVERAKRDKREGKAPSTQAGEFVREEIEHVRRGKHGARSPEQAIAIGLSKARKAGVKLPPPGSKKASSASKKRSSSSTKRSRARTAALQREGRSAASKPALARHSRAVARKRSAASRSASAKKAARTRKAK